MGIAVPIMADSITRDVTDRLPAGAGSPTSGLEVLGCLTGLLVLLVGLLGAAHEWALRPSTSST